jgi:paired amphipathic helix protein Sin3a
MENSELMHAMHFVNEVKFRFRHKEGVFKSFLVAIDMYKKGLVDMNYLCHEVGGLFKDHPDLLEGFSIYTSNPMIRKEEEEKSVALIEKHGLNAAVDRGHLLFRKIGKVLGESALREILVYSHCYSIGEIEKSDLSLLATDVLRCRPGLLEEFNDFLDCCYGFLGSDLAKKSPSKRKRSPSGNQEESNCLYDKPDFSKRQQVTPSYYEWPAKDQIPNFDEEDCPLNNCLRIGPGNLTGSGRSSRGRTKSKEEKLRDDYEDKKYELDMLVASIASTTKAAEKLMIMNSENPIPVEEGLSSMNLRCIENLYGENGIELLGVLRENPRAVLPVIVPRLQRKLEEAKEWARCFTFKKYSELNFVL